MPKWHYILWKIGKNQLINTIFCAKIMQNDEMYN